MQQKSCYFFIFEITILHGLILQGALAEKGAILDDDYIGFCYPKRAKALYESTDPTIQEAVKALKEARARKRDLHPSPKQG